MNTQPTPPIALNAESATQHFATTPVTLSDEFLSALHATGADIATERAQLAEHSRDWWPLAMTWAKDNQVGALASVVVTPKTQQQVQEIMRLCSTHTIPVTAAGGRSGVVGGSIPLYGGVVLSLTQLRGIRSVDVDSGIVDVWAGTFGNDLEEELQSTYGLTIGHWPQSVALSTVGGWLAHRGAGQFSNRYGTIADIVVGLDVVRANGELLVTGGNARQSTGPDLNQLFVGSEGTLGIITSARLRAFPVPSANFSAAWTFPTFAAAVDACRRISRRGLEPAALRLYDAAEANRNWQTGDVAVLLAYDEGDPETVAAAQRITEQECAQATAIGSELVDRWLSHRNDVSALEALISRGYLVDTMEITIPWSKTNEVYEKVVAAISSIPKVLTCTAHLSHSYPDGACLYFTFAAAEASDELYTQIWDAGTRTALSVGASLSHHHGIGMNRARFMNEALGANAMTTLNDIRNALDPQGILNPGKMGFSSRFGPVPLGGDKHV